MRWGRRRLLPGLVALPLVTAGCAFEGQIGLQLVGGGPVVLTQSSQAELTRHLVKGRTTRAGQVVKIDCSVTGTFDVREATGSAVLVQTYVVHLRTRPLPRGTPYQLDCVGPVIVQLPTAASNVQGTATSASEGAAAPIRAGSDHVDRACVRQASAGRRGNAVRDRGLVGAFVRQLRGRPVVHPARRRCIPGEGALHRLDRVRTFEVRPTDPTLVTKMSRVPALTVQPSSNPSLSIPHLFGGIRSYGEATRTVSCGR